MRLNIWCSFSSKVFHSSHRLQLYSARVICWRLTLKATWFLVTLLRMIKHFLSDSLAPNRSSSDGLKHRPRVIITSTTRWTDYCIPEISLSHVHSTENCWAQHSASDPVTLNINVCALMGDRAKNIIFIFMHWLWNTGFVILNQIRFKMPRIRNKMQ